MVRDENGQALRADDGEIVFYCGGAEFLRTFITETTRLDQNYQLRLRMDMQRLGTQSYTNLANSSGTAFTLGVVLNNIVYYPIEMSAPRSVGRPGERTRLDLTLGVDSDRDGIPDAWEQSQLYAGGVMPGQNGWDLSLLTRDGDFDGDGISNWQEYIAGTFATDPPIISRCASPRPSPPRARRRRRCRRILAVVYPTPPQPRATRRPARSR